MHGVTLVSILYSLSSILGSVRAEQLPSNIICIPLRGARSVACHPNKPVVYVGLAARTNGMNLATFELDKNGKLLLESRRQHADGLMEGGAVPPGSEYGVGSIAFNPTLPQVYLSAIPERMAIFRSNTNASFLASLALDEDGRPQGKSGAIRRPTRTLAFRFLTCDPLGRYLYLSDNHGPTTLWNVGDVAPTIAPVKYQPPRKNAREPRSSRAKAKGDDGLGVLPIKAANWVYVPGWNRCFGSEIGTHKVIFSFSQDGRSCGFVQRMETQSKSMFEIQVSVRHCKLYVPNALGPKMAVYQLTRDGRLTSLPRYVTVDPARLTSLDDVSARLYVVTGKGALSIYTLDSEGYPVPEPKRFELNAGVVNDMALASNGTLYLACTAPPGGTM